MTEKKNSRALLFHQGGCLAVAAVATIWAASKGDSWAFGVWVLVASGCLILFAYSLFRTGVIPMAYIDRTVAVGVACAIIGQYAWLAVIRGDDVDRQRAAASPAAVAACEARYSAPNKWWLFGVSIQQFDLCLRDQDTAYPGIVALTEMQACHRLGPRAPEVKACRDLALQK